ncbi:Restriction endonuclease [Acholeplasma oculi]|uniref:Restriction endonuclease n=1 Tax=Acholeplasma oculi TaxID=35623 RepID=A0A061A8L0_9MOLU|nr:restriction endonuclease [Acholeplasma oculi]CDR30210.1 restriction endonuclease [Acholeplasma oculi]SKC43911.1 restriction system protein [Acholeplasma oculi]SUT88585.1 Restriction endonuclease [Acholeplasma oculi]
MKKDNLLSKSDIKFLVENKDIVIGSFGIAAIILATMDYGILYLILGVLLTMISLVMRGYTLYKTYKRNKRIEHTRMKYNFKKINTMDGYQFEKFVADSLKLIGYSTELTKKSGDFGIDVIAKTKNKVIGIQVKHYKSKVGYDAIKEVHAGGKIFKCNEYWVVISNNHGFTRQAKIGAEKLNIKLLDIDEFALMLDIK